MLVIGSWYVLYVAWFCKMVKITTNSVPCSGVGDLNPSAELSPFLCIILHLPSSSPTLHPSIHPSYLNLSLSPSLFACALQTSDLFFHHWDHSTSPPDQSTEHSSHLLCLCRFSASFRLSLSLSLPFSSPSPTLPNPQEIIQDCILVLFRICSWHVHHPARVRRL